MKKKLITKAKINDQKNKWETEITKGTQKQGAKQK